MGNLCGKVEPDGLPPGRVVAQPPPRPRTSAPPPKVGGPPRTLGRSPSAPSDQGDARTRAAQAAESRAKAATKGGRLQSQLSSQKKLSQSQTLQQASAQERRAREADEAAGSRSWN